MDDEPTDELDARCILPVVAEGLIAFAKARSNHRERQADQTDLDGKEQEERSKFVRDINSQLNRKQRAGLSNFLTRLANRIDP